MSKQRSYYEHFQIEDVLNFSSGQLFLARSPQGMEVLLHEIKYKDQLPANYKETLMRLKLSHLAPISEIYEDAHSAVIVHQALSSEPLTLLVTQQEPFPYQKALLLFKKLLKIVVDLSKLPLPVVTSLDPRNIVLDGTQPILLYYDLRQPGRKIHYDEAWRGLLYYLVTGNRSKDKPYPQLNELRMNSRIPSKVQDLIKECINPNRSLEEILRLTEQLEVPIGKRRDEHPSENKRIITRTVGAAVATSLVVGYFVMQSDAINTDQSKPQTTTPISKTVEGHQIVGQVAWVEFKGKSEKSWLSPVQLKGVTHIQYQLRQKENAPFSGLLISYGTNVGGTSQQYGLNADSTGEVAIIGEQQSLPGQEIATPSARESKAFYLNKHHTYQVDMYLIPKQPLRMTVTDLNAKRQWKTIGPIMADEIYQFRFRGNEDSEVKQVMFYQLKSPDLALNKWLDEQPWDLTHGELVTNEEGIWVQPQSVWEVTKPDATNTFGIQFERTNQSSGDVLELELETIERLRFGFVWQNKQRFKLVEKNTFQILKSQKVAWAWDPKAPVKFYVTNNGAEIQIKIQQKNHTEVINYQFSRPITIKKARLIADHEMKVNVLTGDEIDTQPKTEAKTEMKPSEEKLTE